MSLQPRPKEVLLRQAPAAGDSLTQDARSSLAVSRRMPVDLEAPVPEPGGPGTPSIVKARAAQSLGPTRLGYLGRRIAITATPHIAHLRARITDDPQV